MPLERSPQRDELKKIMRRESKSFDQTNVVMLSTNIASKKIMLPTNKEKLLRSLSKP